MVIIGACLWGLSGTAAQQLFQFENVSTEWLVTIRLLISGAILFLFIIRSEQKRNIWNFKLNSDANKIILFGLLVMLTVQYTYFASIKEGNALLHFVTIFSPYIYHCILTFQIEHSSIKN